MPVWSDFTKLSWPGERDACGVGFVAHVGGRASHDVLAHGLTALENLAHRGAVSADGKTGDGAGVLTQVPHRLFRRELEARGVGLERDRDLAVGVFFVANDAPAARVFALVKDELARSPLETLAWRTPPTDPEALGEQARARLPHIRQVLLRRPRWQGEEAFERTLYLTRKRIERRLRDAGLGRAYVCSLSSRTIAYKGLMAASQLERFYLDLADPDYETAICVFHQRYSTNTVPRWSLAQPFRLLAHNGEINTLQGNVNFMRAREPRLTGRVWGDEVKDLVPVIDDGASDSGALDNALELLTRSGRDLPHALMMLLPQAYENDAEVSADLRGFYDYHATLMEPWDGPAALAVTDGRYAVAALDRNGLRPQRYWLTADDLLVVASEAGVLPAEDDRVVERGRLGPGRMIAVDTLEGRLLRDDELKARYAGRRPYGTWVERYQVGLEPAEEDVAAGDGVDLRRAQQVFGYHAEEYDRIFEPMAVRGETPLGSMGDDTPLAALSALPQLTYGYFKQRFAQVTNPPMDPLRESVVMSLATVLGPRASVLDEEPEAARVMRFPGPVIDAATLAALRSQTVLGTAVLDCTFPVAAGEEGLARALEELADRAQDEVASGVAVLILSDRGFGPDRAPVPMLLAVGAVHHRLLLVGRRTRAAIVCDTGEPREDHHYACLIGFGAALVHPYLALQTVRDVAKGGKGWDPVDPDEAVAHYVSAVEKGLLKTMSKIGISTLAAYRGAQVFEQVGLSADVVERYFYGTPGLAGGVDLGVLARDALAFHAAAYPEAPERLTDRGVYRFRKAGEYHALNPDVFKPLHKAVRTGSQEAFAEYLSAVDGRRPATVRDLLEVTPAGPPVPLDEVEPIAELVKRFTTQAMSHGSVSREAHEALAIAMNRLGGRSNSGEGGEDPVRFGPYERDMPERSHSPTWHPRAGDHANSAIKQVASGRFGVTPHYLVSARELEIKMAQGSKPGEGGQIPGYKVSEEIAAIRHAVPGVTLISPPPHHDIYSIEDLAQLIHDLKNSNPSARIHVKLVAEVGVGTVAAGVSKAHADVVLISGHDGGTGASPLTSLKHAGGPWELGLAETQQTLLLNGLRERIVVQTDGQLKTGRDVVVAALLGAEEFGFATAPLVVSGCIMMRVCHLDTCPVGVATQNPVLRERYTGKPEFVVNFFEYIAEEVREYLAELGFRTLDEAIGHAEMLDVSRAVDHWKAAGLDLTPILHVPALPEGAARRRTTGQDHGLEKSLDVTQLVPLAQPALESAGSERVSAALEIRNTNRTVGTMLGYELTKKYRGAGLP
ncbi:MAG TPA: glutamate synthase large subunit, partial [Trueperaceae bacterium]